MKKPVETINVGDTVKITKKMGLRLELSDHTKKWKVVERLPFGRVVIEDDDKLQFQISEMRIEKVTAK